MSLQEILGAQRPTPRANSSGGAPLRGANHLADLPTRTGYGVERVKVTADLAQHYLSFNRINRPVIQARVNRYAEDHMRGEFSETGDTIKFSRSGRLLDGQHRLLAILKTGKPMHLLVVHGVADEVAADLDVGGQRKGGDILGMEGLGRWDSRVGASAAHVVINVSKGLPIFSAVKRSNREIQNFYLEHPAFCSSISFVSQLPRHQPPIPHARAVALHYLFAQKDRVAADAFMTKLFFGDELPKTSPIFQLREKLREARLKRAPMSARAQFHGCVKAWNYTRARRFIGSARSLFPRSDEALPEIE